MSQERTLLYPHAAALKRTAISYIEVPHYYQHAMTADEANFLPWRDFSERLPYTRKIKQHGSDLEFLLAPKSPPWTNKDCALFVGSDSRRIATIAHLSPEEGKLFLGMNAHVATELLASADTVHVTIGFNERDTLPGQHSIKERLHSHIYIPDDQDQLRKTATVPFQQLSWFDRMSLIEPFTPVYRDFLKVMLTQGLFKQFVLPQEIQQNPGYLSLVIDPHAQFADLFCDLQAFFIALESTYESIEGLYTDRSYSPDTDRYVPLSRNDCVQNVSEFVSANNWLSDESVDLLSYVAVHLKEAAPRSPTMKSLATAQHVYFSKGIAGAFNFAIMRNGDHIRFDFLPCTYTTSSMNKILLGKGVPTIITRGSHMASEIEKEHMMRFTNTVAGYLDSFVLSHQQDRTYQAI